MEHCTRINYSSETQLEKNVLYSRMVKTPPFIKIGGTTAIDYKGVIHGLGDSYQQVHYILSKQIAMIEAAGAKREDIVNVRMFATPDFDVDASRAFTELLGDVKPLSTLIVITSLFRPELLVEIEMEAVIGCSEEVTQGSPVLF